MSSGRGATSSGGASSPGRGATTEGRGPRTRVEIRRSPGKALEPTANYEARPPEKANAEERDWKVDKEIKGNVVEGEKGCEEAP